jgi:hypothetical protein
MLSHRRDSQQNHDFTGERKARASDRSDASRIREGPERLIDWGTRHVQGHKNRASIAAAGELISHYRPQILVLEDVGARHCRRRRGVRELVEALDHYGRERGLTVRKMARVKARRALSASNKAQTAQAIAARFPKLTHQLPPERKPWMSEDPRMAIFDAAALALVLLLIKTSPPPRTEAGQSPASSGRIPR